VRRIEEARLRAKERQERAKASREAQWRHAGADEEVAAGITTQKMLASLREKDDELERLRARIETLGIDVRAADANVANEKDRVTDLERRLAASDDIKHRETQRANELQAELSRVKGLFANSQFELDLTEQKYSKLLTKTAAKLSEHELHQQQLQHQRALLSQQIPAETDEDDDD